MHSVPGLPFKATPGQASHVSQLGLYQLSGKAGLVLLDVPFLLLFTACSPPPES